MPATTDFLEERREVEALLSSSLFARAPNLAQLLSYSCTKFFQGEAHEIKEYNIAVEALGRPPGFDQKRDSIVRVEAHRLRKRLKEYYDGEGATHTIRIEIPPGQYAPRFLVQDLQAHNSRPDTAELAIQTEVLEPLALAPALAIIPQPQPIKPVNPFKPATWPAARFLWLGAGLAAALALIAMQTWRGGASTERAPFSGSQPGANVEDTVRILAGLEEGAYLDGFGRVWEKDRFFNGGTVFGLKTNTVLGTRDPQLYSHRREGVFGYDIPLKPGLYEMRLYFAETYYGETNIAGGGEASRIFNIIANGVPIAKDLDVIAEAGPSAADIRVFKDISPAADGILHLRFEQLNSVPFVNAIEIVPGVPGKMRPLRIVARDRGHTAPDGTFWEPDRFSRGGQLVTRADPVSATADPELYRGERFGNLTYAIPVAPGRYTLVLHFAETWFGANKPGGGGAGSRVFDVLCNGIALERGVDIFRQAGGGDRALVKTFRGLQPNSQGKLLVSLVPVRNYACINALEILDESKP